MYCRIGTAVARACCTAITPDHRLAVYGLQMPRVPSAEVLERYYTVDKRPTRILNCMRTENTTTTKATRINLDFVRADIREAS